MSVPLIGMKWLRLHRNDWSVGSDMKHIGMLVKMWHDQAGALLSSEYILLGCILTIGLIVGISAAQVALVEELDDYSHAIDGLLTTGVDGTNGVTFDGGESGGYSPLP